MWGLQETCNDSEVGAAESMDADLESKRLLLQEAVWGYISSAYLAEDTAGSVFAKEGNLIITISGEKTNLKNFWSGRMTSTWTVVLQTNTEAAFSGELKVLKYTVVKTMPSTLTGKKTI